MDGHVVKITPMIFGSTKEHDEIFWSEYYCPRVINCVAVVYNITSRTSFGHAQGCVAGIPLEKEDIPLNFPIPLFGSKGDLEDQREVQTVEIVEIAVKLGVKFFEKSAITGENGDAAFNHVAQGI